MVSLFTDMEMTEACKYLDGVKVGMSVDEGRILIIRQFASTCEGA